MTDAKSQVRLNAERDPSYCPYCLHCRSMARMQLVEPFHWRCAECGAEHDEREAVPDPAPAPADRTIRQEIACDPGSRVQELVVEVRPSAQEQEFMVLTVIGNGIELSEIHIFDGGFGPVLGVLAPEGALLKIIPLSRAAMPNLITLEDARHAKSQ